MKTYTYKQVSDTVAMIYEDGKAMTVSTREPDGWTVSFDRDVSWINKTWSNPSLDSMMDDLLTIKFL
jgi:hypothetical protein